MEQFKKCAPAFVRYVLPFRKLMRGQPTVVSSCLMCLLRVDWAICSSAAAFVIFKWCAKTMNSFI